MSVVSDRGWFSSFVSIVKGGVVCAHVREVTHRLVCPREREIGRERKRERGEIS